MANKTIPDLPAGTTLDGTEPIETVQSGASVKTTVNAINAKAVGGSSGDIQINNSGSFGGIAPADVTVGSSTNSVYATSSGSADYSQNSGLLGGASPDATVLSALPNTTNAGDGLTTFNGVQTQIAAYSGGLYNADLQNNATYKASNLVDLVTSAVTSVTNQDGYLNIPGSVGDISINLNENLIAAAIFTSDSSHVTLGDGTFSNTASGVLAALGNPLDASGGLVTYDGAVGKFEPLAIVTPSSPTTGQTVSSGTAKLDETLYITPSGTLLALTVSLPTSANSRVGQLIRAFITQIITTSTFNVSGSGTIVGSAPVTSAVNSSVAFQCVSVAGNGTWIRLS